MNPNESQNVVMEAPAAQEPGAPDKTSRPGIFTVALGTLKQLHFLIAVVVLLIAAVGLNASVQFLQLHFKKEPVPMAMKFADAMPLSMGQWVRVAKDDTMDADTLAALGTEEFLFCSYVNAKELGLTVDQVKARFAGKSWSEQQQLVAEYRSRKWSSVLTVGLTYYTGKADTVAHIPERCYVGSGFEPVDPQSVTWSMPDGREVPVRYISFEDRVGQSKKQPHHVAYFFHVNGQLTEKSLGVRYALQDLRARHGYYAKFELMCVAPQGQNEAQSAAIQKASEKSMEEFLGHALPAFEQAMPDWSQYAK